MTYKRFAAMIATSTVVMFILMYLNTYAWEHVFFSETRSYMAILMGATMAVIMLAFMLSMYRNTTVNTAIFIGSVAVFALSLWLVRSQTTVGDVSYMRAMIPHHSIAIMTSSRANIRDPRVRELADDIIAAQNREIAQMRYLIGDLQGKELGPVLEPLVAAPATTGTVPQAVDRLMAGSLNPAAFPADEAGEVLQPGPGCVFRRVEASDPIFYARTAADGGGTAGVMKLNDILFPLSGPAGDLSGGADMSAEGVAVSVRPLAPGETALAGDLARADAELVFRLDAGRTIGYRGFYSCGS